MYNVLSQSHDNDSVIVLIHQDEQLRSILHRLAQFAEVHFRASSELPYDLHPILIGVLLELRLQVGLSNYSLIHILLDEARIVIGTYTAQRYKFNFRRQSHFILS